MKRGNKEPSEAPHTQLPRECIFNEIDVPALISTPRRTAHIVAETPRPTHRNRHGAQLLLLLSRDQGVDVGLAGKHLHAGRGGVDLLGGAGPGDEEQDLEDLAPAVHGEDLRHPGPDPLEVLGRLDDPDKHELARGDGARGVARHEVAHVRDLVRDADPRGEEHDGAVGAQRLPPVRPLDEGGRDVFAVGRGDGFIVELLGEAGAAPDDEGHGRLAQAQQVVAAHGQFFGGEVGLFVGPGEREGVRHPEPDGGHVEVGVLAGEELPGSRDVEGDFHGVAGQDVDFGFGAAAADVADDEDEEAGAAVGGPGGDDGVEHGHLWAAFQVVPESAEGGDDQGNVEVEEDFVKGVADRGVGLDQDHEECDTGDESGQDHLLVDGLVEVRPAIHLSLGDHVSEGVGNGLEDNDAAKEAVPHVPGIKGNLK